MNAQLGTWKFIVPLLAIYGMGRGTWENTNKAVVADVYTDTPELSTAAFAAISFSNGLAGAIGYFTFAEASRLTMAGLVMVSSLGECGRESKMGGVSMVTLYSLLSLLASFRP